MGCTSSAPKSIASHGNATEYNIQFLEEIEIINQPKKLMIIESNGSQVLPTCDKIDDKQLDRNNRPVSDEQTRMDSTVDRESQTCDDIERYMDSKAENEEKLTSLDEVVDKVVELFVSEMSVNAVENVHGDNKIQEPDSETNTQHEDIAVTDCREPAGQTAYQNVENELEDLASPSQSESSRATRWEALADIAAELPPSLAVDPVTGQIYALSK